MRTLQHRRHSRRDPTGAHLNEAGLALARRVAPGLPRFARAVTSPRPRAVETAEALGYRVDATIPELAELPDDAGVESVEEFRRMDVPRYVRLLGESPSFRRYAGDQAELWRRELARVADGEALLMVSHGTIIEAGMLAALPALRDGGGGPLDYLEGVELRLEGGRWVGGSVLRVAPEDPALSR
jgi:broad specificity phosphatase PhoE